MRDAAGERTHRLEPLRLAQLPLQPPQLLLGLVPLGHVEHEPDHARGLPFGVEEHAALGLQPAHRAVRVNDAILGGDVPGLVARA